MFFKSIRFSLTLRYCLTLAVILVLFSCFLYVTIRKQFYQEVDKDLLTIAEALASPTLEPFRNSPASVFDQVLEDFIGPKASGKFVQLFDNTGTATASSKNLQGIAFPLSKAALREASLGKVTYRTDRLGAIPVRSIIFPVVTDGSLSRIVHISSSLEDITDSPPPHSLRNMHFNSVGNLSVRVRWLVSGRSGFETGGHAYQECPQNNARKTWAHRLRSRQSPRRTRATCGDIQRYPCQAGKLIQKNKAIFRRCIP